MEIEPMFRDYKSRGYYLEGTGLKCQRLMVLILLIALVAYSSAIVQETTLKIKIVKKYIVRDNEQKKTILDGVPLVVV